LWFFIGCLLTESAKIEGIQTPNLDDTDSGCLEVELCDGLDNDCDGQLSDLELDLDGDGFVACDLTTDWLGDAQILGGLDCDDDNSEIFPTATERCDGVSTSCLVTLPELELDLDGDGFVTCTIDEITGWLGDVQVLGGDDCDDQDSQIHPMAVEVEADAIDQDCDGLERCYQDLDFDGFGSDLLVESIDITCATTGVSMQSTDCDDADALVMPGVEEVWYDGIDQNCDGLSDYDQDGDGQDAELYGGDDCDDTDSLILWSDVVIEGIADGVDQNCDGFELCYLDADGDRVGGSFTVESQDITCSQIGLSDVFADCDDDLDVVYPNAPELCDGVLNDCLSTFPSTEQDVDGDGFVVCTPTDWLGSSAVVGGGDCNDSDLTVFPSATETWYDGIDQNCDGWNDFDQDGDGFDADSYGGTDCNDIDASVFVGAIDSWYDGVDQNCDGLSDYDQDGDGQDDMQFGGTDCDDLDAGVYDSNTLAEGIADGIDQNCDGFELCYLDADLDGFGETTTVQSMDFTCLSDGYSTLNTDCEDTIETIYPNAPELCDGLINTCGGSLSLEETDVDGDGYVQCVIEESGWWGTSTVVDGGDCDDLDATIFPTMVEIVGDGIDQDCDGFDATTLTVNDLQPGDLLISEIHPYGTGFYSDWVEIYNATPLDINLNGLILSTSTQSFIFPQDRLLSPGEFFLLYDSSWLSQSFFSNINSYGMSLDLEDNGDWLHLMVGGVIISEVDFSTLTSSTQNTSYVPFMLPYPSGLLPIEEWCPSRSQYYNNRYGTPGEVNDSCDDDGDGDFWHLDCDDSDPTVFNGALDAWYDGIDSDCAGDSDYDADGDGYDSDQFGGADCDDQNPLVNPSGFDIPNNGIDEDCDGVDETSGGNNISR